MPDVRYRVSGDEITHLLFSYSILVVRTLHDLLEPIYWWRHRTDEDQRGAEITRIEYTGRRDHATTTSAERTAGRRGDDSLRT